MSAMHCMLCRMNRTFNMLYKSCMWYCNSGTVVTSRFAAHPIHILMQYVVQKSTSRALALMHDSHKFSCWEVTNVKLYQYMWHTEIQDFYRLLWIRCRRYSVRSLVPHLHMCDVQSACTFPLKSQRCIMSSSTTYLLDAFSVADYCNST